MSTFQHRAVVVDRFIAEHDIDPGAVLGLELTGSRYAGTDVEMHVYSRVPSLTYDTERSSHHLYARETREDVKIRVIYVPDDEEPAA